MLRFNKIRIDIFHFLTNSSSHLCRFVPQLKSVTKFKKSLDIHKNTMIPLTQQMMFVLCHKLCQFLKACSKVHSLIAALIKSPWWKMLSFLCLYNIKKTCQIAVCNNLLWWNDTLWFHFTIVDITYCNLTSFFYIIKTK